MEFDAFAEGQTAAKPVNGNIGLVGETTEGVAEFEVGIQLPYLRYSLGSAEDSIATNDVLVAHGLGSTNPKSKTHLNDEWVSSVGIPGSKLSQCSNFVAYTARGHGHSHGWEDTASTNPDQFTWRELSSDMIRLADYFSMSTFVACGSSMGSATSLYAASIHPHRVKAAVLIRPPTAWEARAHRRKNLLSSARKCHEKHPHDLHYLVLEGATKADLPSVEDTTFYERVTCPVLIMTVRGDDAHPIFTAETLRDLIPQARLFIADDADQAQREFPGILASFLKSL